MPILLPRTQQGVHRPRHGTRVINLIRHESAAQRILFTGGDPLMPYDNHLEVALAHTMDRGFGTNLHTNELLLADRHSGLREYATLYSLAIDGPDAATADWFRGTGYFERSLSNVEMLVADQRRLAPNTFTTTESVRWLRQLAQQINNIAARTNIEYWLISQYRPIGRPNSRKSEIDDYSPATFIAAEDHVQGIVGNVEVFAQPTWPPDDPHPFRAWILADGIVIGRSRQRGRATQRRGRQHAFRGLKPLIRRAFALRDTQFSASDPDDPATPTEN